MITNKELNAVKLSPTKKDFYQIWNELLDTAGKISERWDPASTNESDPGVVLLKVLTAVADKLNYNIDVNTLEAFMPSAAQEESMRKLTEMMGYSMKYYQSATTEVKISYKKNSTDPIDGPMSPVSIDKFTNIKDIDEMINYVTLDALNLNKDNPSGNVKCMEGSLVECESDDNNIISMFHLDDNKRYYLPETHIAENGIFITNIANNIEGTEWKQVGNLNAQAMGSKVFKFGFDSQEGLPYVQFPEDISTIIEDGLRIKYIRTSGADGNISMNTLSKLTAPASWSRISSENKQEYHVVDNYSVSNIRASTNGSNREGINSAYNNFKKTIGTFDTLVTCRDYMNKIYQLVSEVDNTTPLVSNVIVSDIKDDINRAVTLGTFTSRGLEYKVMAKGANASNATTITETEYNALNNDDVLNGTGTTNNNHGSKLIGNIYKVQPTDAAEKPFYVMCNYNKTDQKYIFETIPGQTLTHFDLILYPFKGTTNLNSKKEFVKSFTFDDSNVAEILTSIEDTKTLSHNIITPDKSELACIKNYYKVRAKINTVRKVGAIEQANILTNVYTKLFEHFNMRQMDFGEEIPYDTLLSVMENADPRIKNISLDEPELTTKFWTVDNKACTTTETINSTTDVSGNKYYNQLVLNNVLAGRVPMFNYDTNFKPEFNESTYTADPDYKQTYNEDIYKIKTNLEIPVDAVKGSNSFTLGPNEVITFRAPSFVAAGDYTTYPAYVNYYLHLNKEGTRGISAIPATMQPLKTFLRGGALADNDTVKRNLEYYINDTNFPTELIAELSVNDDIRTKEEDFKNKFIEIENTTAGIFIKNSESNRYEYVDAIAAWEKIDGVAKENQPKFYLVVFEPSATSSKGISAWNNWLSRLTECYIDARDNNFNSPITEGSTSIIGTTRVTLGTDERPKLNFYTIADVALSALPGRLVASNGNTFRQVQSAKHIADDPFAYYCVPRIWSTTEEPNSTDSNPTENNWHTLDGLGQTPEPFVLAKGVEYKLKRDEYLLINYTHSSTNAAGEETSVVENIPYTTGTIIKPNFELSDSEDWYNARHSYTKSGVELAFKEQNANLPGMFTLGTDQQIEIRKIAKVELNKPATNLYWEIPWLVSTQDEGRIDFPWDEEIMYFTDNTYSTKSNTETAFKKYMAYTLKEGEYLYYTDMNKSDIAFYGFGSTIRRGINTPAIYKYTKDDVISTADISSQGMNAAIPWRAYNLSSSNGALEIIENQFITLTEGDTLLEFELEENASKIDNEYRTVKSASYRFASDTGNNVSNNLPQINVDESTKWKVCSRLDLALNPTKAQVLKKRDIPNSSEKIIDSITLFKTTNPGTPGAEDSIIEELKAKDSSNPLSIKANKLIRSTSTVTDVTTKKTTTDGEVEEIIADLQLKLFKNADIKASTGTGTNISYGPAINFGNYGDGQFTAVNFEELAKSMNSTSVVSLPLNILLPNSSTFGLIMIFYQNLSKGTNSARAKIVSDKSNNIRIYNNSTVYDSEIILNNGINVIEVKSSCKLEIKSNGNNNATVIFSDLSVIPTGAPLNPKLCYKQITLTTTPYAQILKDIKAIDKNNEFYYNMPIAGNIDIDMNPNDEKDNLENPLSWFNYNNINNKFVIAEIDTTSLNDGIVIAKASKSNF